MSSIIKLRKIFKENKTIAIVGLSNDWFRPSYFVGKYMMDKGFDIIPVNPKYSKILNKKCYANLKDIPKKVDIVDVFRKNEYCKEIASEAVNIGAKVLWLQLGIINKDVKDIIKNSNLELIMDRCIKIEHARLFGGLNFFGVNTQIISSKRFF
tara:strand:+ start:408 stop:866 length:459 start_codon:yes stop_codon:yes gene_type:complete